MVPAERDLTKIAVFAFELDDRSAGRGIIGEDAIDKENLKLATKEAHRGKDGSGPGIGERQMHLDRSSEHRATEARLMNGIVVRTPARLAWMIIAGCAVQALLTVAAVPVSAGDDLPAVALADFSYKDTSGEVRDQTQEHRARLDMLNRLFRENLANGGKFSVIEFSCESSQCVVEDGVAPPALAESAAKAGARYLVVGGVQKMSTLVQWGRVVVLDLKERNALLDRLYTFRGDTDDAWRHAALFALRHVNDLRLDD